MGQADATTRGFAVPDRDVTCPRGRMNTSHAATTTSDTDTTTGARWSTLSASTVTSAGATAQTTCVIMASKPIALGTNASGTSPSSIARNPPGVVDGPAPATNAAIASTVTFCVSASVVNAPAPTSSPT